MDYKTEEDIRCQYIDREVNKENKRRQIYLNEKNPIYNPDLFNFIPYIKIEDYIENNSDLSQVMEIDYQSEKIFNKNCENEKINDFDSEYSTFHQTMSVSSTLKNSGILNYNKILENSNTQNSNNLELFTFQYQNFEGSNIHPMSITMEEEFEMIDNCSLSMRKGNL